MSKPKLLLITSKKVGDTGTISFSYIFQDESLKAFNNFPSECSGLFGIVNKTDTEGTFYINAFKGGDGIRFAAPLIIGDAEQNEKTVKDCFPDAFNLLCTTEVADAIRPLISEWVEVNTLVSNQTLLTAK